MCLIRGTTQFRAEPATLIFLFHFYDVVSSAWRTLVQPATRCLVLKRNKKIYISIFNFNSLATSFDTFVDFSAPPLSVKCGIQNTSNGFILTSFSRKSKEQERLLELNAVFF